MKELRLERSMYDILQILSTTAFEKIGLRELFSQNDLHDSRVDAQQMALGLEI